MWDCHIIPTRDILQIYSNSSVEFRLSILTPPPRPVYAHPHGPPFPACPRFPLWSQAPL